ncbi:YaaR family protein [Anaeropeptidivorans aminofermentans]|jgi:hypothetical protein|uniref:YaaR family protein n=1 Tax=Anaeropeptidivorans aminofermentans TaxID=2934315 RepID=UPI002025031F|nr:YaaR family protein [Anaeropeptidivorans aminofermentans]
MDLRVSEILANNLNEVQSKVKKPPHEEFSFTLSKLGEEGLAARLSSLIDDISLQGEKISKHMDFNDMKQYRSLIKDFINEVVTNSHEFSRENYLDRRGRHRVFGIVRVINKEVDELAQELLKSEKDHLAILDKVGQIKGLLLDIMV